MKGYFERHFRLGLAAVLSLGVALGFVLALLIGIADMNRAGVSGNDTPPGGDTPGPPPVPVVTTTASTKVYLVRRFALSNTSEITLVDMTAAMIGLDEAQMRGLYGDWTMDSFSEDRVTFSREYSAYGPGSFTLTTMKDGGSEILVVYAYDVEGKRTVREKLSTPIENFEPGDLDRLRAGITVLGEEELIRLLENYSEGFE